MHPLKSTAAAVLSVVLWSVCLTLSTAALTKEAQFCQDQSNCYSCSAVSYCGWCPTLGVCTHATEDPCHSMMDSCFGNFNYLGGARVVEHAIDMAEEREHAIQRYEAEAREHAKYARVERHHRHDHITGLPIVYDESGHNSSESAKNASESSKNSTAPRFGGRSELEEAAPSHTASLFKSLFGDVATVNDQPSDQTNNQDAPASAYTSSMFKSLFGDAEPAPESDNQPPSAQPDAQPDTQPNDVRFGGRIEQEDSSAPVEPPYSLYEKVFGSAGHEQPSESPAESHVPETPAEHPSSEAPTGHASLFARLFGSEHASAVEEHHSPAASESSTHAVSSLLGRLFGSDATAPSASESAVEPAHSSESSSEHMTALFSKLFGHSESASPESSAGPEESPLHDVESSEASSDSLGADFAGSGLDDEHPSPSSESVMPTFHDGHWDFESSNHNPYESREQPHSHGSESVMPAYSDGHWDFEPQDHGHGHDHDHAEEPEPAQGEIDGVLGALLDDAHESAVDAHAFSDEHTLRRHSFAQQLADASEATEDEESILALQDNSVVQSLLLHEPESASSYFNEHSPEHHYDEEAQRMAQLLLDEAASEASQEFENNELAEAAAHDAAASNVQHEDAEQAASPMRLAAPHVVSAVHSTSASYSAAKAAPLSSSSILGTLSVPSPHVFLKGEASKSLSESVFQETSDMASAEMDSDESQLKDLAAKTADGESELHEVEQAIEVGDSSVVESYKRNQQEVHLAISALQQLKAATEAKQSSVLAELNQAKVASEALAADNDNNERLLNKLASRIKAAEARLDSLNPAGLDTIVAKTLEVNLEKKESELLHDQQHKLDDEVKKASERVKQAEAEAGKLRDRLRAIDQDIASKKEQVHQLHNKIAAVRAQQRTEADSLHHAVNDVGSLQSQALDSRSQLHHESTALARSSLNSDLSSRYGSSSQHAHAEHTVRVLESSVAAKKDELNSVEKKRQQVIQEVKHKESLLADAKSEILKLESHIEDVNKLIKTLEAQKKQVELDLKVQMEKVTQLKLAQTAVEEQRALKSKEVSELTVLVENKLQDQIQSVKEARKHHTESSSRVAAESAVSKAKFKNLLSKMALNPK